MAASYRSRFLAIMRSLERELAALFQGLSDEAIRTLVQAADASGTIPVGALFTVQQSVQAAVMRRFVARTGDGTLSPFMALPNGDILPLSSYSRILFDHIGRVEALAIEQQRSIAQRLTADAFQGQLRQTPLFRPNPLAQYEQAHTWVDPNGYQLSERIWNTAGNTRRRLDLFLDDAIRRGEGALKISRNLEQFLIPGRAPLRTKRPYGTDASYDAMRLARTEVSRAHAGAFENTAKQNPFVAGLNWNTSGSHPKPDVCDTHQAGGPYPFDDHPTMPAHPQCLCYWTNVIADNTQEIIDSMALGRGIPEPVKRQPGEFETLAEAVRWGKENYPNINWDFTGAHIDAINPTLAQFDKLGKEWPDVAGRLEYVGTYLGKGAPSVKFNSSTFAHASYSDGKRIGLNPDWYGNPVKFRQAVKDSFDSGWLDADGSIESVMTHEYGHMVEGWLTRAGKAFVPHPQVDGFGIVSSTVDMFNRKNRPTKSLSMYAITTNSPKTARYEDWARDRVEGWAEGFAAIYHRPRRSWPVYVNRLDTLLSEMGNSANWRVATEVTWIYDMPLGPERDEAIERMRQIKERLNI